MELQAAFDVLLTSDSALDGLDALIWQSLAAGAISAGHPWANGCLTTLSVSATGRVCPSSRTVVLRRCDIAERSIDCHTDLRSAKVHELAAQGGEVCWLFYDQASRIQLRLQGVAHVLNDRSVDADWENVSSLSRSAYLSVEIPGKAVAGQQPPSTKDRFVDPQESERGRDNFRVVRTKIEAADWLYLKYGGHVRASFRYVEGGVAEASWLVP